MKRYLKVLLSFAVVVLASAMVMLAACATSVAGKTYKFSDVEVSVEGDLSDLDQAGIDFAVELMKKSLGDITFVFNEDGTVNVSADGGTGVASGVTYTQDGAVVSFTGLSDIDLGSTAEAKGNTLTFTVDSEEIGGTVKVIFQMQ